jgi:hypothetical protein
MVIAKLGGGENAICARKVVESDDEHSHFHVEVGLESAIGPWGEPGTREDVLDIPEGLDGKELGITAWGRYRIERGSIPSSGLVISMGSMPVPARGAYQGTVTGCTVRLAGEGPVAELRWWESDADVIGVEVTIHCKLTFDNRLLVEAHRLIDDGLQALM